MSLADTRDPNSLSSKLRRKRDVKLRQIITDISAKNNAVKIIDVGGTLGYWERVGLDFLRSNNAHIILVNLHATELSNLGENTDIFENIVGNGCDLSQIADGQFDLAHSNSVIEHVYGWANMKAFAKEFARVAKSYYIQTPYYWFPVDPHFYKMPFFHWMPKAVRARLLMAFPLAYRGRIATIEEARHVVAGADLLNGKKMQFLFPDAKLNYEKFMGLRKSMIACKK